MTKTPQPKKNYPSSNNPFLTEDWFVEVAKLDIQVQNSQKNSYQRFSKKLIYKNGHLGFFKEFYLSTARFITNNFAFSMVLAFAAICTLGVSASEIMAPQDFKPSTFLFGKGSRIIEQDTQFTRSSSAVSSVTNTTNTIKPNVTVAENLPKINYEKSTVVLQSSQKSSSISSSLYDQNSQETKPRISSSSQSFSSSSEISSISTNTIFNNSPVLSIERTK